MKRTILVMLLVALIATPCFAQEVETDGMFSIDETLWWHLGYLIVFSNYPPFFEIKIRNEEMGFYQGTICWSSDGCWKDWPFIIDTPGLGIVSYPIYLGVIDLCVMQPTVGIGVNVAFGCGPSGFSGVRGTGEFSGFQCAFGIGIMLKVDDNWKPPGEE